MEWKGKRVTIMGLGQMGGGIGAAQYFARRGAKVTATDLKTDVELSLSLAQLRGLDIEYVLGKHRGEDFTDADLIVQSPAVPETSFYLKIARQVGVCIETDASFFVSESSSFLIGVTGTKGKTTTATLIAEAFRALAIPYVLVGTPGTSFCSTIAYLESKWEPHVVIAEFSSWQLESITPHRKSPPVAVVTNIFPDHLNRYPDFLAYRRAKETIFRFQSSDDVLLIPVGAIFLQEILSSALGRVEQVPPSAFPAPLQLLGGHQKQNAALAFAAIREAFGHPAFPDIAHSENLDRAVEAIAAFRGVPGRLEFVGECEDRRFVNDTTATNPGATMAALDALESPVILIAGGEDKKLPYHELAVFISERVKHLVLLPGTATDKLVRALRQRNFRRFVKLASSMDDATKKAYARSESGDIILLSPAAASFNMFRNEFDRGEQFVRSVEKICQLQ